MSDVVQSAAKEAVVLNGFHEADAKGVVQSAAKEAVVLNGNSTEDLMTKGSVRCKRSGRAELSSLREDAMRMVQSAAKEAVVLNTLPL